MSSTLDFSKSPFEGHRFFVWMINLDLAKYYRDWIFDQQGQLAESDKATHIITDFMSYRCVHDFPMRGLIVDVGWLEECLQRGEYIDPLPWRIWSLAITFRLPPETLKVLKESLSRMFCHLDEELYVYTTYLCASIDDVKHAHPDIAQTAIQGTQLVSVAWLNSTLREKIAQDPDAYDVMPLKGHTVYVSGSYPGGLRRAREGIERLGGEFHLIPTYGTKYLVLQDGEQLSDNVWLSPEIKPYEWLAGLLEVENIVIVGPDQGSQSVYFPLVWDDSN